MWRRQFLVSLLLSASVLLAPVLCHAQGLPPVASNVVVATPEGAAQSGVLPATDAEGNPLTFSIVTPPAKGSLVIDDAATGAFTYTPNAGAVGYDTFTFSAADAAAPSTATGAVFIVGNSPRWPGQTLRASVGSGGMQANGSSIYGGIPSADGRFITFNSDASNLVAGDTNGVLDVFVFDRQTAVTTRVSVSSGGAQSNDLSLASAITPDGRYVAFTSFASNLVAGDTNGQIDVFVHDRQTAQTTRVSVATDGTQGNDESVLPAISADGRYVAFYGRASNLVPGDTNDAEDVFLHDRQTGVTTLVSVSTDGVQGNSNSWRPSMSADGRFIAFQSESTNLVANDTNGQIDVFIRDVRNLGTSRGSVSTGGFQVNGGSQGTITAGGRHLVFVSAATNAVAGDTNGVNDAFVYDRQTGQTTIVSEGTTGQANDHITYANGSADGRYIVMQSAASNLVMGDTNGVDDVFVHDRETYETVPVSISGDGVQGNTASAGDEEFGSGPVISADGRSIVFPSSANNLVPDDTNVTEDLFVVGPVRVNPTAFAVLGVGGQRSVDVTFDYPGTPWPATTTTPWITITPPGGGSGNSTVQFTVAKNNSFERTGTLVVATQTVSVTQGPATVPVAQSGSFSTPEDTPFSGTLSAADADGDAITFSAGGLTLHGSVIINSNGFYTYTPTFNYSGPDSFSFQVTDGTTFSNTATITVTVTPVNDTPVANNLVIATSQGSSRSGSFFAFDSDSGSLTYSIVTAPVKGTILITNAATGAFSYTPNPGAIGYDSFTFQASDGNSAGSANGSVFIVTNSAQWPGQTTRVSIATDGTQGNGPTTMGAMPSADGRFVVFTSAATNLAPDIAPDSVNVFVRDRQTGETTLVSRASGGGLPIQGIIPRISADGRYVVFMSPPSGVPGGHPDAVLDIFVHDRQTGETSRANVATDGTPGNGESGLPAISADGRFVAFTSSATNLAASDTVDDNDIYLRDRQTGQATLISVGPGGVKGNSGSWFPTMSADGRFIVFQSGASNLVANDTNGSIDVFMRDLVSQTTTRVSVAAGGAQSNGNTQGVVSADGRVIALESDATNMIGGDTNGVGDIFVRDLNANSTTRVSRSSSGTQGNGRSWAPSISANGRFVAFRSEATNLVPGDTNGLVDEFVHDRQTGQTFRINVGAGGVQANAASVGDADGCCVGPVISDDGRVISYASLASNLVANDTNATDDIFVAQAITPGVITGTVTATATGLAVAGVTVAVYDSVGFFRGNSTTNNAGTWAVASLNAGTYYARAAANFAGYITEQFNNFHCGFCSTTSGTPIAVASGATTTGIDFALEQGGRIAGRITDGDTGTGVAGSATIYNSNGNVLFTQNTDADGNYTTGFGLPAGSYFVRSGNSLGYINELYDDIILVAPFDATIGQPVVVVGTATTSNINFALARGGTISGRVTRASTGAGLANVSVAIYNSNGAFYNSRTTDSDGNYSTLLGLPSGTYYARTSNSIGLVDERYNDQPCLNCAVTLGSPIVIAGPGNIANINFDLSESGRIVGTVTSNTGTLLSGIVMRIYNSLGDNVTTVSTDPSGNYAVGGLPAGSYFVAAENSSGFLDKLYENLPWSQDDDGVDAIAGTPIPVTVGAIAAANFTLTPGGRIAGRVTDAVTGAGLSDVEVSIVDSVTLKGTEADTDEQGYYISEAGLPAGTYYVATYSSGGKIDELYNNVVCLNCNDPTGGTTVTVVEGATTNGIDFALAEGGRVSGRVTDSATGLPIQAEVYIYNSVGHMVAAGETDIDGNYETLQGLPTGTYYAGTANYRGYIDESFGGLTCPFECATITAGTAFTVTAGVITNNIDFALARGGQIRGRISDDALTMVLGSVTVQVFDLAGTHLTSVHSDPSGNYVTGGLPAGSYFARTANQFGFIDELFEDVMCLNCAVTTGTQVNVSVGAFTSHTDFTLARGGRVRGIVTNAATSAAMANVEVRLFDQAGVLVSSVRTGFNGAYQTAAVPAGTYFAVAAGPSGFQSRLYDGLPCNACDPTTGTAFAVVVGGVVNNVNFALPAAAPSISLSSTSVLPGATITATIANGPGHRFDWTGLYPVANGTTGFLPGSTKYLSGTTTPPASGLTGAVLTFSAPLVGGQYNVRLISGSSGNMVVTSETITVISLASVTLTSATTMPAGGIVSALIANGPGVNRFDWVGFYPLNNGPTGYIELKYLNNSSTAPASAMTGGTVSFTTPTNLPPGQYNVRFMSAAGTLLATTATVTITGAPTISLSATAIARGGSVTATIANSPGQSRFDWVGFYPIGNSVSGFVQMRYLNDSATAPASPLTSGAVTFTTAAILTPGQYHIRLVSAAGSVLATSATITVPGITVSPAAISPGGGSVTVTIIHSPGVSRFDWVAFYPIANGVTGYAVPLKYLNNSTTAPASPLTSGVVAFTVPPTLPPGQYHARLISAAGTTLGTSNDITVLPLPSVSPSTTSTPTGGIVSATIANSPGVSRFDWVGFYPIANGVGGYLALRYVNNSATAPASPLTGGNVSFDTAGWAPGQYNIRLISAAGSVLATSATITVTSAATIDLSATTVLSGGTVTATVAGGPSSRYNWVGFYPLTNGVTGFLALKYVNDSTTAPASPATGGIVTFDTTGRAPGLYNIRFVSAAGSVLATSATITVISASSLNVSSTNVLPGGTVTVTAANGPGVRWDWVGLFPVNNGNTGFVTFKYLNDTQTAPASPLTGGVLTFTMPTTPGQYNFRFFYTYDSVPIATSVTVTVSP